MKTKVSIVLNKQTQENVGKLYKILHEAGISDVYWPQGNTNLLNHLDFLNNTRNDDVIVYLRSAGDDEYGWDMCTNRILAREIEDGDTLVIQNLIEQDFSAIYNIVVKDELSAQISIIRKEINDPNPPES